jgi:ApbE superfamily uncharacterized protein (UPF0280 family)
MSELVLAKVEIEETAATIAAERQYVDQAVIAIKAARREVERQIRRDDFFLTTLDPFDPPTGCAEIVRRMCDSSRAAGVGPMATVAGAVAQAALEAMVSKGCRHGWVDNGGDIALILERPVTVEVFSQPGAKDALALQVEPTGSILGLCTSSGRLGHSISLGDADASVAIAADALLADALATAIANRVIDGTSLRTCFDDFRETRGFEAGFVIRDGEVAMFGKVPRILEVEHNPERVTVHSRMAPSRYMGHAIYETEVRA